jgi:hypothetical protein
VSLVDSKYTTPADLAVFDRAGVTVYGYTQEQVSASRKAPGQPSPCRQLPKSAFVWLEGEQQYQCPEGRRLSRRAIRTKRCAGGQTVCTTIYACAADHCQSCSRRAECMPSGNVKQHRNLTRLCGHGLSAAGAEVGLSVLVHNALALLAALDGSASPPRPPPNPQKNARKNETVSGDRTTTGGDSLGWPLPAPETKASDQTQTIDPTIRRDIGMSSPFAAIASDSIPAGRLGQRPATKRHDPCCGRGGAPNRW